VTGGAFGPVAGDYLRESGNLKLEKPFSRSELRDLVADRFEPPKYLPCGPGRPWRHRTGTLLSITKSPPAASSQARACTSRKITLRRPSW
jgi:hypothetical protein